MWSGGHLQCDYKSAVTRFRLSAKRTSPFKSAGASVQSTTGSRGVRVSGSNAGYTMFRGSVKSTGYPLHSSVSPSLPLPCVTVCHHISTGLYHNILLFPFYVHSMCSRWGDRGEGDTATFIGGRIIILNGGKKYIQYLLCERMLNFGAKQTKFQ